MNLKEASKLLLQYLIEDGIELSRAAIICQKFEHDFIHQDIRFSKPWLVWKSKQVVLKKEIERRNRKY